MRKSAAAQQTGISALLLILCFTLTILEKIEFELFAIAKL